MRRLEPLEERRDVWLAPTAQARAEPVHVPDAAETEFDSPSLPHGHPEWVKDALSVSQRGRALVDRLRPVVVRVLTFWDHRLRSVLVNARRVSIDASGSYRID